MWTLLPGDWRATSSEWLIPRLAPIAARAQRNLGAAGAATLPPRETSSACMMVPPPTQCRQAATLAALEYWLPRWRDSAWNLLQSMMR